MGELIKEIQDYRHLEWSRIRHSSGTAGSFLKAQEILCGVKKYYKLSNCDFAEGIIGHECVNEFVVDRLLSLMGIPHLSYDLVHALVVVDGIEREVYLCESENFRRRNESKCAFDVFCEVGKYNTNDVIKICQRMGWEQDVYTMLMVDYLILNRDRHGANIEVLKDAVTKVVRLAPLFDHGLSLIFSCHSDSEIDKYDIFEDKKVQSFVGGSSTYENLRLIPKDKMPSAAKALEVTPEMLFDGLDGIVTTKWMNTVYTMIVERAKVYEGLRTSK